jgi:hypothetical protein
VKCPADHPSTDVFVETVNVLGKRSGHETALKTAGDLIV